MRKQIFWRCFGIAAAAVLVCGVVSALIISMVEETRLADDLIQMETAILEHYDLGADSEELADYISELTGGTRVTIIDHEGEVLLDTGANADEMENHAQRPEMLLARQGKRAAERRYSSTLERSMLYVAKMDDNGVVLRVAVPLETLYTNFMQMLPAFLIGILAALICSQLLSRKMADDALSPLISARLAMEHISDSASPTDAIEFTGYEEIDGIIRSMNTMGSSIAEHISAL